MFQLHLSCWNSSSTRRKRGARRPLCASTTSTLAPFATQEALQIGDPIGARALPQQLGQLVGQRRLPPVVPRRGGAVGAAVRTARQRVVVEKVGDGAAVAVEAEELSGINSFSSRAATSIATSHTCAAPGSASGGGGAGPMQT